MTITALKEQMRSLALQAKGVVDDESMTAAEKREKLDAYEADIKSLGEKIADEEHLAEQRKHYAGLLADDGVEQRDSRSDDFAGKSWGEQFVASDAFRHTVASRGEKGHRFTSGAVELKATMTTAASAVVQPDVQQGILTINFQRLTVADLLASGQTNGGTVRYLSETTATNAAAAVAEEGLKPESTLILDEVDEPVRKIATILRTTDEMLEDVAQTQSYINSRGRFFVEQEREDQLLNGSGVGANITGIRNRTGLQTDVAYTTGAKADSIYNQITAIRANAFLEPDGIIVHPNDWQDIRLAKDTNGAYYGPGPFAADAVERLWGLPVVVTTAITEGTALVGAFRSAAQVFYRGGITVEMTNSDGEDFRYNRVAFRFEQRMALAVYRPGAFGEVTGL